MCYASGNILWKTTSLEESNIDEVCFTIDIVCGKRLCQSIDVSKSTYRNYRKLFYCTGNLDVQILELFFFNWNLLSLKTLSSLYHFMHIKTSLTPSVIWSKGSILLFFFLSSCVVFATGAFLTFIKLLLYM